MTDEYEIEPGKGVWRNGGLRTGWLLVGTPYSVRSDLCRGWHICRDNVALDKVDFDTLSEAKINCEIKAARFLNACPAN